MVKFQIQTIRAIVILLMLGASPLSVTYSFAETNDNQEEKYGENATKSIKKNGLGAILTEKIVNGKLEVRHYILPNEFSNEDLRRMLSIEDQISWAYVNYEAYHSGIVLFDGKASKVGENLWKISTNNMLNFGEGQIGLELSKKSNDYQMLMDETELDEDLNYRVIFSGKITETDEENEFVVFFMNSVLKNPEMTQNNRLLQTDEIAINSEKMICSSQEFNNYIR